VERRLTVAVTNTSPIIALWKVNGLGLLDLLFERLVVPADVSAELLMRDDPIHEALLGVRHMEFGVLPTRVVLPGLGVGESAAIEIARRTSASIVILDEARARKTARLLGLTVTGTVGVLTTAKRRGFVSELRPLFLALRAQDFWLGPDLVDQALASVGERPISPGPKARKPR
jgi:predicted nucleic acid-binding protein